MFTHLRTCFVFGFVVDVSVDRVLGWKIEIFREIISGMWVLLWKQSDLVDVCKVAPILLWKGTFVVIARNYGFASSSSTSIYWSGRRINRSYLYHFEREMRTNAAFISHFRLSVSVSLLSWRSILIHEDC